MGRRGGRPGLHSPRAGGQATVELAMALPVVAMALLLVVQVALVAQAQILVVHAAREGARAAAVDPQPGAAARAARVTPGLRPSGLHVVSSPRGPSSSIIRVTVHYRARTDVPLVGLLLGDVKVRAAVAMRVEDPNP